MADEAGGFEGCLAWIGPAALLLLAAMLGAYAYFEWDQARGRLPPGVEVERVLVNDSQVGGFLEGCSLAVYGISRASADDLAWRGSTALEGQIPEKDRADNPYGPWRATPLMIDDDQRYRDPNTGESANLFALGAAGGCADQRSRVPINAHGTLRRAGAFYSVTRNGEGLILIDPRRRLAAWMYFG